MPLPLRPHSFTTARLTSRRCFLRPPHTRSFSPVTAPARCEQITVPCRSNGSITVDLFHAALPSSSIVIYLPPGPVIPTTSQDQQDIISLLRDTTTATVARINYRASSLHQHPTPYHDVLFGYDWIRDNLLRDEFQRPYLARIGVCGELMGGSLATILALTECRLGESRIVAAAVNNPIVDWVFPEDLPSVDPSELPEPVAADETVLPADEDPMSSLQSMADLHPPKPPRKRQKRPSKKTLTSWERQSDNPTMPTLTLLAERDVLFRRPEDCFDRFASPIHFFRSPHAQLLRPPQDHVFASRQPDELLDVETQFSLNHFASVDPNTTSEQEMPILTRCRAYARNYPPAGTKLSLPNWSITASTSSPLYDQAAELAKMLRRSVARHTLKTHSGRIRWHDANEKIMYEEHAEQKVQLNTMDGLGLWSEQSDSEMFEQDVRNTGVWLKQHIELSS